MSTTVSPYISSYLRGYRFRRQLIGFCGVYLWMISLEMFVVVLLARARRWTGWPEKVEGIGLPIVLLCLGLPALALLNTIRRRNLVTAAIEIERQLPQFDQRLITVASNPPESSLLTQVAQEVETIARAHRPRVSLRPLLGPVLAMIAAGLVLLLYR